MPKVEPSSLMANHAVVLGSSMTSENPWLRKLSTSASLPGLASMRTSSRLVTAVAVSVTTDLLSIDVRFRMLGHRGAMPPVLNRSSRSCRGRRPSWLRSCPSALRGGEEGSNPAPTLREITGSRGCASGAPRLLLVLALGELLDDLGAERRKVVRVAARNQALIGDDLLVEHLGAGVAQVGAHARVGGELAALYDAGIDERPRTVAERPDRLALLEEGPDEVHRVVVDAQLVGVHGPAREDQGVVVVRRRL